MIDKENLSHISSYQTLSEATNLRSFKPRARTKLVKKVVAYAPVGVELLTAIPLWAQICAQLFNELRAGLITFPIFVRCQRLIARNDRELFSSNRGISHLNEACRIDELSRGSILGYEILTF